jgi:hypothetical protein
MHILNNFEMTYCKHISTVTFMNMKKPNETSSDSGEIDPHIYRHMIASLMYLVSIGPDIGYAVNVLSRFTKHVLRYLRGTISYGMRYASSIDMRM